MNLIKFEVNYGKSANAIHVVNLDSLVSVYYYPEQETIILSFGVGNTLSYSLVRKNCPVEVWKEVMGMITSAKPGQINP